MTGRTASPEGRRGSLWRMALWVALAALLAVPAVAMRFAPGAGFDWTASDFVIMGAMLGLVGLGLELATRASRSRSYRAAAILAVLTAFLTIWVNLAVGMIGDEDNPYNFAFAGVLLIALLGSLLARFRPEGMAWAMLAAAAAQALAGGLGIATDLRGGLLSALFALPWLLSAALFRKAAREG